METFFPYKLVNKPNQEFERLEGEPKKKNQEIHQILRKKKE